MAVFQQQYADRVATFAAIGDVAAAMDDDSHVRKPRGKRAGRLAHMRRIFSSLGGSSIPGLLQSFALYTSLARSS